ncbi:hypothetical protein D9758_010574 [Tetrapyrgos nigripes]|uniref:Transmembrane protein n=1 Tax=Tetrapyrgos nigripes TaxID=182062 RepID=A0A8H5D521_9AGAR|nr:hypothetical protein D9758_010574 [Tetrapyrgos nigripes]
MSSLIQSSSSRPLVIVDDQDDSIEYSGSWSPKGDDISFQGTATGTTQVGATLKFDFVGSYVAVYAAVDSGVVLSTSAVTFSLDNDTQKGTYDVKSSRDGDESAAAQDGYHILIWESTRDLADKNHTLVLTRTAADDIDGESLLIDFLVYVPTENTEFGERMTLFVDDRDPGIVYGEAGGGQGWENYDLATPVLNHTLMTTTAPGSVMSYSFLGTGIGMYGLLDSSSDGNVNDTLNLTAAIDDQPVQQYHLGLPSLVGYGVQFFQLKDLEHGNHTVTVTNTNNLTLDFDYFLVTPGVAPATTASPSNPTGNPGDTSDSSSGRSVPVGVIVGGVVGALVLVGFVGALLVWLRRRRNPKRSFSADNLLSDDVAVAPSPYLVSSLEHSSSSAGGAAPVASGWNRQPRAFFSKGRPQVASGNVEALSASTNEKLGGAGSTDASTVDSGQSPTALASTGTMRAESQVRASTITNGTSSQQPYVDSGLRFDARPPPLYTEQ